jgi:choice-of-anchor C domain-containing protein
MSVLAIFTATTLPAHANLITNGDFSVPCSGPYIGFCQNVGPADWTVTFGDVDVVNSMWGEYSGAQSVDLNGDVAGGIAQTFVTIPGVTYRVSFDMGGNPFGNDQGADPIKTMNVLVTGNATHSFSYDTTGTPLIFGTAFDWVYHEFTFVATGTFTTLEFDSTTTGPNNCCWGAVVTNAAVVDLPEPASFGLILPGLLGCLALRRLRIAR